MVRLALSIARKILHREAQMDPLLLAGVVRVALDQMQAGTRVLLRTSPASARTWTASAPHISGHRAYAVRWCPTPCLTGQAASWKPK